MKKSYFLLVACIVAMLISLLAFGQSNSRYERLEHVLPLPEKALYQQLPHRPPMQISKSTVAWEIAPWFIGIAILSFFVTGVRAEEWDSLPRSLAYRDIVLTNCYVLLICFTGLFLCSITSLGSLSDLGEDWIALAGGFVVYGYGGFAFALLFLAAEYLWWKVRAARNKKSFIEMH